jgi:hypothetical protein
MAASPILKVFNAEGEYVASCKYAGDAACLISMYGDGAQIRLGHSKKSVLWDEGNEFHPAADSYDFVAEVVDHRITEICKSIAKSMVP